jgi:hypothetical protein
MKGEGAVESRAAGSRTDSIIIGLLEDNERKRKI